MLSRIDEIAQRALGDDTAISSRIPDQAPEDVLELLRNLGAAMSRAQDNAERITQILDDVAKAYGAYGVSFFVLPTGIFVRIESGTSSRIDFAPTTSAGALRLDQIDQLYRIVDDIRHGALDVASASRRLEEMLAAPRRLGNWSIVVGTTILTLGLGLMLNPTAGAVPAYLMLGLLVGVLQWVSERERTLAMILPVAAAFAVTWASSAWVAPAFDAPPLDLVIAALVVFLPGAALTMATVELAGGSMLSGSARLVYGLQRLLLLSFGIAMGFQVAGLPDQVGRTGSMGAWAPWVGVFVFAVGHFFANAAPGRTFAWLVLVLYAAYAAQFVAGTFFGSLGGSFVAGAVVLPVAYFVQDRKSGPPVPATFLPAFWMLVPGALGLEGVTQIIGEKGAAGLGDFLNALLAVVAIAIGVLVGSGFSERVGRATSHWRGI
ncbi:threonine/serine exporter ThrE family protein [Nocardioides sp. SR21]|uniref:threonine/serine ThrE exporter family protein n=1 Tax=Nocardioides sp. SR21 TaxID=2919501 RepID=UPI001FAAF6A5|nr:threonine/serine exporter family protein [Nocardioides sp. SR21]